MATRVNKFAALSPDYEEEEKQRLEKEAQSKKKEVKKEAKKEPEKAPKEESAPVEHVEPKKEYAQGPPAARGQGYGRGYRGGRGFQRGRGVVYVQKGMGEQRDSKDFRFSGSNDPVHPYDRRSGTGRGTESQKQGAGRGNWGRPGDELYYEEKEEVIEPKKEDIKPAAAEVPKTEEVKKEGEKGAQGKRKRRKEEKKEEKEEEDLDADGTALTYKEYQAKLAANTLIVKEKKPEEKVVIDPKKASQIKAYVKENYAPKTTEEPIKKEIENKPANTISGLNYLGNNDFLKFIGTFIPGEDERRGRGRGRRRGGYRDRRDAPREEGEHAEAPKEEQAQPEDVENSRGRGGYRRRRGGFRSRRGERRGEEHGFENAKVEQKPFEMKTEDFPSL